MAAHRRRRTNPIPHAGQLAIVLSVVLASAPRPAVADTSAEVPPPVAAPAEAAPDGAKKQPTTLQDAKRFFLQANRLRKAGDCQRALELYLRSRALHATVASTLNAAVCLRKLGRFDEALDLCETLLIETDHPLSDRLREVVASELSHLRAKVARIDVQANVQGRLLIDGRPRGRLPRIVPLRVLPGTHRVVVLKEGYESFSRVVEATREKVITINATLRPLVSAGRLRITALENQGATVLIDESPVGTAPWEGNLKPGQHTVRVEGDTRGSAPTVLTVLRGRTLRHEVKSLALGGRLRLTVAPSAASLSMGGIPIGSGRFEGRLPIGRHR
ncbi:MAG: PEGA domain-containing protein, partial [Polyangiaceae bacterium]